MAADAEAEAEAEAEAAEADADASGRRGGMVRFGRTAAVKCGNRMRVNGLAAAALAVLVVIGWFLWPFPGAIKDPGGSAMAALRAVALFVFVLGAANAAADFLPNTHVLAARCVIAFGVSTAIGVSVALGLELLQTADETSFDLKSVAISSATDAFWCTVAVALYSWLTLSPSLNPRPRGSQDKPASHGR